MNLEGRVPLTAETYCLEVRLFLAWIEEAGLFLETIDILGLSSYLQMRRADIDSRSAAKAISGLRSFFRFVVDEQLRPDNPAALLEMPRKGERFPLTLGREAVDRMLAGIDLSTPLGLRDRALYELIYSAGLRVSEAVALNLPDLMFAESLLRVHGKGDKERFAVFGKEAETSLKKYLEEARPILARGNRNSALFLGRTGRRLSRKGMWKNYREITAVAGIGSKLHSLRHTFATELLAGGADLRSVQELLGHADLTTTQIYTHLDTSGLRENHRRYVPRLSEYRTKGNGTVQ
jgi:integrase/recombinase XerD